MLEAVAERLRQELQLKALAIELWQPSAKTTRYAAGDAQALACAARRIQRGQGPAGWSVWPARRARRARPLGDASFTPTRGAAAHRGRTPRAHQGRRAARRRVAAGRPCGPFRRCQRRSPGVGRRRPDRAWRSIERVCARKPPKPRSCGGPTSCGAPCSTRCRTTCARHWPPSWPRPAASAARRRVDRGGPRRAFSKPSRTRPSA